MLFPHVLLMLSASPRMSGFIFQVSNKAPPSLHQALYTGPDLLEKWSTLHPAGVFSNIRDWVSKHLVLGEINLRFAFNFNVFLIFKCHFLKFGAINLCEISLQTSLMISHLCLQGCAMHYNSCIPQYHHNVLLFAQWVSSRCGCCRMKTRHCSAWDMASGFSDHCTSESSAFLVCLFLISLFETPAPDSLLLQMNSNFSITSWFSCDDSSLQGKLPLASMTVSKLEDCDAHKHAFELNGK